MTVLHLPERPGPHRLGRHVNHDERNRDHPIAAHPQYDPKAPVRAKSWMTARLPLDQRDLGSCEGNAGIRATAESPGHPHRWYTERAAVKAYIVATNLDPFPGAYPPDDTGTDTTSMLKALQQLGYITEYRWGFTIQELYWSLSYLGPGILGMVWKTGMDHPKPNGEIVESGSERGGHALCCDLIDPNAPGFGGGGVLGGWQSWGLASPFPKGRWLMSFSTWASLREQQGEMGIGLCA